MPDERFDYFYFLNHPAEMEKDPKTLIADQFSTTASERQLKMGMESYAYRANDSETLLEGDSMQASSLWVEKPAAREERAKLSRQLHTEMAGLLQHTLDVQNKTSQFHSSLEELILLSLRDKPEEYQQRMESLQEIPEWQTPEREPYDKEAGERFVQSFHNMTKGMSPESIRDMSDQELVGNFQTLAMLSSIKNGNRSILKDLPEKERESINGFYNNCGDALDEAMRRTQVIASPYYQYFHTDRIPPYDFSDRYMAKYQSGDIDSSYEDEAGGYVENQLPSGEGIPFDMFCMQSQRANMDTLQAQERSVLNAVKKDHKELLTSSPEEVAPEQITWYTGQANYNGYSSAPLSVVQELRSGKTVYAMMPDDTVTAISGSIQKNGSLSVKTRAGSIDDIVNANRLETQKNMKGLADELSSAHPWYSFSSDQFKEMKSAFKAVQDGLKAMGDKPTEQQRKEMAEKLALLSAKCQSYVEYKDNSRIISRDEHGTVERPQTETDMKRKNVANRIKEAAERFQSTLGMREQVGQRQQAKHEEKRASHEAWQEKVQEGFGKQRQDAEAFKNREPAAPDQQKAKTKIEDLYRKCTGWAGGSDPESDCGKTVENLRQNALFGVPDLVDGAAFPSVLSDRARASLDKKIATFVAYEMIQQERGDHFDGKAGPLERKCAENQEAFINMVRRSPAFEHSVGEITPQRLEKFIMEDGARKVATEIFRKAAERAPEARQSQPQPQKKMDGPQKQM